MGKRIQVGNRRFVSYPHPFLPGIFKAGIITFTFRAQGIGAFEVSAVPVNREPSVIRNGDVFCTAAVFFSIVEVFMMAGAVGVGRGFQRATEFLPGVPTGGKLTVLPHGKTSFAYRVSLRKQFGIFRVAFIQRDDAFAVIKRMNLKVNIFGVITFIGKKRAFLQG